jgi:hypothetical protein
LERTTYEFTNDLGECSATAEVVCCIKSEEKSYFFLLEHLSDAPGIRLFAVIGEGADRYPLRASKIEIRIPSEAFSRSELMLTGKIPVIFSRVSPRTFHSYRSLPSPQISLQQEEAWAVSLDR